MSGPSPRDPYLRRRRNPPAGGDWIDLEPVEKPLLGPIPRRTRAEGRWSERARSVWASWRRDPATTQWTSADMATAAETLYLLEQCVREPRSTLASEVRLRMDGLGLTAKGKRNLRWRVRGEAEVLDFPSPAKRRTRRFLAVDPPPKDGA